MLNKITLIGDSVGGTLITALTQRLVINNKLLPNKLILICPVMDATMTNKDISKIDKIDPVLSKIGILSAKKMCAGTTSLKDEIISPLFGSFKSFPETILFLAESDVMYPDQKILVKKLNTTDIKTTIIIGENMPHIWPLLPIMKEAKVALNQLIKLLN